MPKKHRRLPDPIRSGSRLDMTKVMDERIISEVDFWIEASKNNGINISDGDIYDGLEIEHNLGPEIIPDIVKLLKEKIELDPELKNKVEFRLV